MDDTTTFIATPKGDELVVMTRARYDQLVARAKGDVKATHDSRKNSDQDAALADRSRTEWIAAGKPTVPLAVIRRVRAGESYLKAFRSFRGLTQKQLADRAGIGQGYLSAIETRSKMPAEDKRLALAAALNIHPLFLSDEAPRP